MGGLPIAAASSLATSAAAMLWPFIEFVKPYLKANMEDPEERREHARQYLRHREELAGF